MKDEGLRGASGGQGSAAPAAQGTARAGPARSARPFALVVVLALAGLAAAGAAVLAIRPAAPVVSSGEAAIGGPFHLVDQDGRPVDQRILAGKWSAVFFGYTNCPDTCPATLAALQAATARLGGAARDFQVVFVSVDPARDTPAQMKLYVSSQGFPAGRLLGLTGSPAQVRAAANAYRAVYHKEGSGPDYAVQHSAAIYLMDPRGRFVRPLEESSTPAELADQIRGAMQG